MRCRITTARDSASMCLITLTINSQKLGRSNEQKRREFAVNLPKRRPRPPPCCRGWRPLPSCDDPQWTIKGSETENPPFFRYFQWLTLHVVHFFLWVRPCTFHIANHTKMQYGERFFLSPLMQSVGLSPACYALWTLRKFPNANVHVLLHIKHQGKNAVS